MVKILVTINSCHVSSEVPASIIVPPRSLLQFKIFISHPQSLQKTYSILDLHPNKLYTFDKVLILCSLQLSSLLVVSATLTLFLLIDIQRQQHVRAFLFTLFFLGLTPSCYSGLISNFTSSQRLPDDSLYDIVLFSVQAHLPPARYKRMSSKVDSNIICLTLYCMYSITQKNAQMTVNTT